MAQFGSAQRLQQEFIQTLDHAKLTYLILIPGAGAGVALWCVEDPGDNQYSVTPLPTFS